MKIPDITAEKLDSWDNYKGKKAEEIIETVYMRIEKTSRTMCGWYWASIDKKRKVSYFVRLLAYVLLAIGTTLPLIAAVQTTSDEKLLLTQWGIACLLLAGLAQLGDRVFGWSSGWMRYVTTVTTMENLTRSFQMAWGKYLVSKTESLNISDAQALFELASGLEQELTKLQADETSKWVSEFNTGIQLLDNMINKQREETEKQLQAIRAELSAQTSAAIIDEKAKIPGSLEVTLVFISGPKLIKIGLDGNTQEEFLGNSWTQLTVSVGRHIVQINTTSIPSRRIERIVEVKPDALTRLDVQVGE